MTETPSARIRQQIERVYGSLDHPLFHFTWAALAIQPYRELFERLGARFEPRQDTEPNDDVSFGLLLLMSDGPRILRASMVGPYALLLRLQTPGPAVVVEPDGPLTDEERVVLALLQERGLELLDRATLDERIPLALFKVEANECRLYQALFVDSDVVPWEYVQP